MKNAISILGTLLILCQVSGCARSDSKIFEQSVLAAIAANGISFDLPRIQNQDSAAAKEKAKEMIALMEKSLTDARKVSDSFLESLHPEMKKFYRDFLMQGQALYLEGHRTGNTSAQVSAIQLMMKWGEFWDRNKNKILDRLGRGTSTD